MNAGRIMTLQEADEDRRVARSAMRGILMAASNLHAADSADLMTRAERVAVVAATHAAAVDAARAERLLSAAVPPELGGEGASTADIVDVCYMLGRNCASTAMVYAMHQTKIACLVRHGRGSAWHQRVSRRLCAEQLLLASSTTEGRARQPSSPMPRPPTASSPPRDALLRPQARTRFWSPSSKTTTRSSGSTAG